MAWGGREEAEVEKRWTQWLEIKVLRRILLN